MVSDKEITAASSQDCWKTNTKQKNDLRYNLTCLLYIVETRNFVNSVQCLIDMYKKKFLTDIHNIMLDLHK